MQIDAFDWVKFNSLTSLYLLIISTRLILIVDTNETITEIPNRQMCTKTQQMLSFGKYQTYQMSSNITYVSRVYAQNFLAYSLLDNILIFIEPKHQLHVYNAQSIRLIVNITTTKIVYATSCVSLISDDQHELFFVSESRSEPNLVSIRVCQVRFDRLKFNFEEKKCIETLNIRCTIPDIRINGFTIKRDHAGTKRSLLFVSTDVGLVYAIFSTMTGSLIREPVVLNDTLSEGSVVVTSSGIVYYANKQEHTIHEILIAKDFRIRYGKIIKSKAIKSPFALITDECDHLYIATKSMILVMFIEKYVTIRSVFSKASDLPISLERLNSTTYVYATVTKPSAKSLTVWMFNFLSFRDPEKNITTTRMPVITTQEKLDFHNNQAHTTNTSELLPSTMGTTEADISFSSTREMSKQTSTEYSTSTLSSEAHFQSTFTQQPSSGSSQPAEDTTYATDSETLTSNVQTLTSTSLSTEVNIIVDDTYDGMEIVFDDDTTSVDTTTLSTDVSSTYSQFSTSFDVTSSIFSSTETSPTVNSISTTLTETTTMFFDISTEHTTVQSVSTEVTSTSLETTMRTTSEDLSEITVLYSSTPFEQSTSYINDVITSTIPLETISTENQSHWTTSRTSSSSENDSTESSMITDSTTYAVYTSLSDEDMDDKINSKYSSPVLIKVDVSSSVYPSSPSELSSTDLTFASPSSEPPSSLHSSLAQSSTTSVKLYQLLSSKYFSVTTTGSTSTPPTTFSSSISTIETTDLATTSDTTQQSSTITFSSSPPLLTSSFMYTTSPEATSTEYITLSTAIDSTTLIDTTTMITTVESSTIRFETTENNEVLTTTDSPPPETTSIFSTTEERTSEYTSTQTSLEIISTAFPDVYTSKTEYSTLIETSSKPRPPRPPRRRTSESTTTSTTTITTKIHRPRKEEVTRQTSASSTTTTIATTVIETTSIYRQRSTLPPPVSIWRTKWNSLQPQQQMVVFKPLLNTTSSNTLLSNELLHSLFNRSSNSSNEKLIYIDLADLPPSTWNISLHTNESILLDIVLPPPSLSSNPDSTTNLTITNVEADRFSTSIVGVPVNLQVDNIHAKQFSLAMNLTNDQVSQSTSDVIIGHIKSEQFELNITKSDNMNLHVQQVDSETAELFFDSKFCTNESNLQINLNLSKNGTIRYGNRTPIRIGSVFTRVHMLKQSCDLEQPFTLFFDICQGQNPCLNDGTCQSQTPNYDDPSFSQKDSSQINYQCHCPPRISGEHCQYSDYPFGYCINGGTLLSKIDLNNQTIEECLCTQGYQGEHCEDNIDDCLQISCSHHGVCQDGIHTYSCACYEGFYGDQCEQTKMETVLLQVASKSFASLAILLIASIAGLVIASDIHTYLTRKKQKSPYRLDGLPRVTSEVFENSVLLLGFGDAPIEMSDLSTIDRSRKTTSIKRPRKKMKKQARYEQLAERRYTKTLEKPPSKHFLLSNPSYETIL